jgi:hypothetical protein
MYFMMLVYLDKILISVTNITREALEREKAPARTHKNAHNNHFCYKKKLDGILLTHFVFQSYESGLLKKKDEKRTKRSGVGEFCIGHRKIYRAVHNR